MNFRAAMVLAVTFGLVAGLGYLVGDRTIDGWAAVIMFVTGSGAMVAWALLARPAVTRVDGRLLWDALSTELDRSRRRGHRLALVRLVAADPEAAKPQLEVLMRQMDRIEAHEESLLLLLPEASRTEAENLVERLHAAAPSFMLETSRVAVFPEDGVTERALRACLDGQPFFTEPLGRVAEGIEDTDEAASRRMPAGRKAG